MRTPIAILCILLGITTGLCGCTFDAAQHTQVQQGFTEPQYDWPQSGGRTLVIWAKDLDMQRVYLQKAFAWYQDLTGNTLELVQLSGAEYEVQTRSAFQGLAEAPDILLSYGGTNIDALDPDRNFYDFTDAVWVDDLTDTSINQTIYHGRVIGLPHWEASISGILYNKKLFQRHHINVPQTQEEFLQACEQLAQAGVIPVYLPGAEISMLLYQFPLDTLVEDADTLRALNEGAMRYAEMPEMKTVVEWYRTMAQRGYFGETYLTDDWAGMSDALESEQYAMMLCWDTWLYTDFEGDASRFGLMPAFIGIPEKGTFEGPNLNLLIVNKNSPNVDTAVDFITFMADPYNYNVAFEGIYTAPVFKNQIASISTPQYIEAERLIEQNFRNSTAWLRIKGFSQQDASCILAYMSETDGQTAVQCLQAMDRLRQARLE